MRLRLVMLIFLLTESIWAAVSIPGQLNQPDRVKALEILGYGTSSKILTNPYPLGGYYGLEIGLSLETIDTSGLSSLGATAVGQTSLTYPTLTVGKGVYGNIDLYFHFVPFMESTSLSKYGGIVRWGFYQSEVLPINLSLTAHANSSNIDNKIIADSFGLTITGSWQIGRLSLFGGFGRVYLSGTFIGDSSGVIDTGVTDTRETESEGTEGYHTLLGASYLFNGFFVATEIDWYEDPVYSWRVGVRY